MENEIIVAICSLLGTAIGAYSGIRKSNEVVEHRLKELEKKVDKHNQVIERTYILEEKIKVANHRIDDLEEEMKEVKR